MYPETLLFCVLVLGSVGRLSRVTVIWASIKNSNRKKKTRDTMPSLGKRTKAKPRMYYDTYDSIY